ncbi:hypothetical protein DMH18_27285 [Streptomyces sp. WAC 06783]|nr:hypothetical protein DMH18_27285 [Streptomyces sp. WAC 06783]
MSACGLTGCRRRGPRFAARPDGWGSTHQRHRLEAVAARRLREPIAHRNQFPSGTAFFERNMVSRAQTRRKALDILERVQATGSQEDRTAVVTGFLEVLLMAADRGFDLRTVWGDLGTESRAACLALNEFWGVESPGWMRAS